MELLPQRIRSRGVSLNLFKKQAEYIHSTLDVGCWTFVSFSFD
jgi:hypothetical protein